MARSKATTLSYKDLLLSAFREKYLQIFLGIIVILFFLLMLPISTNKKSVIPKKSSGGTSAQTGTFKSYTVKAGDHLWKIAEETYGSGYNAYDIAKANRIAEPNIIAIGQKLVLPKVAAKTPTKGEIAQTQTSKVVEFDTSYTVKSGDYLWKIAVEAYGDGYAWVQIAKANNLTHPDLIYPDTKLLIPKTSPGR